MPREPREKLRSEQWEITRDLTRNVWIEEDGDIESAQRIVKNSLRNGYGSIAGTFLVGLAIKRALRVLKHWHDNRIKEPAFAATADEPEEESNA